MTRYIHFLLIFIFLITNEIIHIVRANNTSPIFLTEPYLGYCQTFVYGDKDSKKEAIQKGILFGEKIGLPIKDQYFALLDFNACLGTYAPDKNDGGKKKGTLASLYFLMGFKVHKDASTWRFWGGLTPLTALAIEYDDRGNGLILSGQGLKLGAGYSPYNYASYNLELIYHQYRHYKESIEHKGSGSRKLPYRVDQLGLFLSASIPIEFIHWN